MRERGIVLVLIGTWIVAVGLPVVASVNLPHRFAPGTPIRSAEVNENFDTLAEAVGALAVGKQEAIGGPPCGAGQFVRNITADGSLECGVDQVGAPGAAGVASLNGLTGSVALQAGPNVTVVTAEDGRITIGADGGGGGLSLPYQGAAASTAAAFEVANAGSGSAVAGTTATGQAGVLGHNTNAAARSMGVWGRSDAAGTFGVYGSSGSGYGVHGVSTSSAGVVGASTGFDGVAGVSQSGRGVRGESTGGIGVLGVALGAAAAVHGVSQGGYGVHGQTTTGAAGVFGTTALAGGAGVLGVDGANSSIAVRGNATRNGSVGVWGQATTATGVYGQSQSGSGVWGTSTTGPAMRAEGYATQSLGAGGWAKAAVFVSSGVIQRCFNSQATNPALVNGGTCGFVVVSRGTNPVSTATITVIDFTFDLLNTFPALTLGYCDGDGSSTTCAGSVRYGVTPTRLEVHVSDLDDDPTSDEDFYLVLF